MQRVEGVGPGVAAKTGYLNSLLVVHQLIVLNSGVDGGRSFCSQRGDGGGYEYVEHRALSSRPNRVGRAGRFAIAVFAAVETHVEANRPIDSLDYLEHGGFASLGEDGEAAELTASRRDELGVGEGLENFGEEAFRGFSNDSEIGKEHAFQLGKSGEVDQNANGVVRSARELHGGVACAGCAGDEWRRCHCDLECSAYPDLSGPIMRTGGRVFGGCHEGMYSSSQTVVCLRRGPA